MRALVLALGLVAVPALAADQFDLLCTGGRGGRETMHYRLDLARGEYCFGKCESIAKIAGVTSGMITLYDDQPKFSGDTRSYNTINRITGEWRWYNFSPRLSVAAMDITGSCELDDFSGFPMLTRKF